MYISFTFLLITIICPCMYNHVNIGIPNYSFSHCEVQSHLSLILEDNEPSLPFTFQNVLLIEQFFMLDALYQSLYI